MQVRSSTPRSQKQPALPVPRPEAWKTPSELVTLGFSKSPVVMMNEAHHGSVHCPRTREVGLEVLPAAHQAGARWLATEALRPDFARTANETRRLPEVESDPRDYLSHQDMRAFLQGALDLGWNLVHYEADSSQLPEGLDQNQAVNWRETEQARHLKERLEQIGGQGKLLVWVGNNHHSETSFGNWVPMGTEFRRLTAVDPFTIDQGQTVNLEPDKPDDFKLKLLESLKEPLEAKGGTAGVLAEDSFFGKSGQDAFIFSTRNNLV